MHQVREEGREMMAKRRVTVEVCDNPRCDSRPQQVDSTEPYALGYHLGKGTWHDGGPIPKTFACSEACITPAVRANIDRERGVDPEDSWG